MNYLDFINNDLFNIIISYFNYDDYIVELVDSFHYLLEIAIMSGVSLDEFYNSYMKKGIVNIKRINEGY